MERYEQEKNNRNCEKKERAALQRQSAALIKS